MSQGTGSRGFGGCDELALKKCPLYTTCPWKIKQVDNWMRSCQNIPFILVVLHRTVCREN